MIDLYAWPTPNAHKVSFMLEECGLAYKVVAVDINVGDQFDPAFLAISPNGRMPAIVDHDGPDGAPVSVFESGAILIYLAEKTGKFLPSGGPARYHVLEWLMWQMGGLGPMSGQAQHFRNIAPEPIPYAIDRYTSEMGRLYQVMDRRLGEATYLGGGDYSIADMACWSWVRLHKRYGQTLDGFPHLKRWYDVVCVRPGTQAGMELLKDKRGQGPITDAAREILFGRTQFEKR